MLIKKVKAIKYSEVTDKKLYMDRRQFIAGSTSLAASGLFSVHSYPQKESLRGQKLPVAKKGAYAVDEKLTPYDEATTYTNFYEFSTGKRSVQRLSRDFRTRPWSLSVEGLVEEKKNFDIDELIGMFPLEERIYRWRCVEAWSMVIPWVGFPLAEFVKKCSPTSKARFVQFETVYAPEQMPGQRTRVLDWPYTEGLRLDEANHPLALVAVGLYGEVLPNQNGAPIRIVIPWKYGFKSGKSIVKIRFVEKMPKTSWRKANPREYGFYANVNPDVRHPRWSQAKERRIGEEGRRPTLMFNGYADEVGHLYSGMDLKKNY
ncbi:MAG: protein-methionine-sulfoxide reductase catalytic subunit MsrP [Candidatus Aminicenantes bacterium]